MTEETSQRIWLRWETLMQEASPNLPYPQAVKEMTRLLEVVLLALNELGTKGKALAFLARVEEPSEEVLERSEVVARFILPIIYQVVRGIAKTSLKTTPKPPGGRPVSCTPEEKEVVRREILASIETGSSEAEAKRRVARKRNLNAKTIDRIWKDRTQSSAQKMSIDDAREILESLMREAKG